MKKAFALTTVAALALVACRGEEVTEAPQQNVMEGPAEVGNEVSFDNAQAAIIDLSDRERNAVFIRAILDAGVACDQVTGSTRVADENGQPTWRVDCGTASAHLISIGRDGTANVLSRTD